ncbi:Cytosolic carboxypeptidase 1 [Fasciola hepatica]|uniref:Cytosolic carboxypeptidase 1 n=1 Tax=Fasciola hepatica TaxID=6192 RepID=A0A4E0RCQ5_FASHE|nr:Cytosolic carboxypeptidase 1 [Fasciola hepatica]
MRFRCFQTGPYASSSFAFFPDFLENQAASCFENDMEKPNRIIGCVVVIVIILRICISAHLHTALFRCNLPIIFYSKLLYRLGPMDQRFGVRARVNQCLSITLCLLRTQVTVLGSCSAAPSTTLCSPLGSSNAPASSWTVCGAGTRGSVSSGLISPGSASATTGSGTGGLMGKCTSSALGPSGSSNLIATNPVSGTSSNMVSGLAHGTSTGTVVTIPSTLSRHLTIVLRTLRLYVSGSGRNNASALGRAGAISLLLRLLALVAGLPPPRTQTGRLSPTVSISKANSSSSTAVGQNSTGCSGSLNSFSTPYLGTAVASRSFSGNFAIGGGNNTGGSGIVGNMASCTSGQDIHSTTSLGRIAAENGLVIGSPIVTAVTATASAAASLQRHRLRISTASRNEKGFASLVGSSSHTSIGFLASTAASMLSAPPALIAGGVRYHSNLLRLVLNTLHCLIRWKHNATRAISSGGISILLDLFLDVHRCDLHGRRIPLQRSALACLKSLTASRAGRKMLIACGGIHTLFAICAGYVGPDPLTPYMGDSAPSRVNTVENEKPFIPHRKHGTQVNSTHGIHSTTSHQYDSITVSKLSASTVLHSSLSSENCEAKRIPPWSGSIQSASGITSSSLSTVPVPSNKSKISTLVPSGTSSSNDGSVAAGDSGFGSGVTDAARTAMDSAHVSRGTKSDELISVLTEATMLLRRCCPRSRLPVSSAEGVLRFPLRHGWSMPKKRLTYLSFSRRDAPITSDAERSPISEGKSTTKDKSLICPVDNLLSGPLGFTAKKEERR